MVTNDWFVEFRRWVRERWANLTGARTPGPPTLADRMEELERAVSRLAREQAKANVGLEELNQTSGQFINESRPALRRLEETLRRRHQFEAGLLEEGRRQGREAIRNEAVQGMIHLLDGLHQAIGAVRGAGADPAWQVGLETVRQRGEEALAGWGIEPTSAPGMLFDPEVHEAVGVLDGDGAAGPVISQEVLRGYRLGERIIRTAKVVVIRSELDDRNRSGDHQLRGGSDWGGWTTPDS